MSAAHVFLGGRRVRLRDRDLLGEGGEGRVFRIGDLALKVLTAPDAARQRKLQAFPDRLPPQVVAPLDLATDDTGAVVGFSMRALEQAVEIHRLGLPRWRSGHLTNEAVLGVFREISDVVARLHARDVVVGDLNDANVVLTRENAVWRPWLIDADSMQFGPHRCVVAHERFLDPRLYGVDLAQTPALSRETDWYALAVLLFTSLLYVHPFGGSHPAHGTLLRRAEARCSVLRSDVKLPPIATRPDVLPDDALAWFERVFENDVREPLPSSILDRRFTACSCGVEHARPTCPACTTRVHVAPPTIARGQLRATRTFHTRRGRIVAVAHDGSLAYAYEEDGVLRREGGGVVVRAAEMPPRFADPNRIVRVAGNATWVGARGRMLRFVAGRIVDDVPVGVARGELAADAGFSGLVHVEGDALVRAADGTRLGHVLEGQTFVRTGPSLGFAYYRAGALTVAFVFDPRRGVLRQIESFPPIAGRLVGWSAVFDEAHVLVTFATDERGRARHVAHLVDAHGEIVATDDAELPPSLHGRAIAGGGVLAATAEGLVLLRADRRAHRLVRARVFPDARDLVSSDAELVVGAGGSVYAVTHDEISHLSFVS